MSQKNKGMDFAGTDEKKMKLNSAEKTSAQQQQRNNIITNGGANDVVSREGVPRQVVNHAATGDLSNRGGGFTRVVRDNKAIGCPPHQPATVDHDDDTDVFYPAGTHKSPHMFFLDGDDEDEDEDYDDNDECDSIAPYADGYHSSQFSTSVSEDVESDSTENTLTKSDEADLQARLRFLPRNNSSNNSITGVGTRSRPRPVPRPFRRANTSPTIMTEAYSPPNRLPVRSQVGASSGAIKLSSSCPAAYSMRWNDVVVSYQAQSNTCSDWQPSGNASKSFQRSDLESTGRFRRYSVASKRDFQKSSSREREPDSLGDDSPEHRMPMGRNRSYSESDVQRLLMKQMGTELRRISDDFLASRGKNGKLTTVSESASEHEEAEHSGDEV